jgi:predicted lipoprotein with Yx(FWY)xxD motif
MRRAFTPPPLLPSTMREQLKRHLSGGRLRFPARIAAAACIPFAVIVSACANDNVTLLTATPTTDASVTLTTEHTVQGDILVTGHGATLYDFAPDTPTQSACLNDGCVFQWPPLIKDGPITVGSKLQRSLVGTLRRPDGSTQISYGGHPLYTYNNDVSAGMVTGQDIDQNGGLWYVLTPAGQEIHTNFAIEYPSKGN